MTLIKYPKDLATAVYLEIKKRDIDIPNEEILVYLFETMFFASIKTEESEPIIFDIVYLDPNNPDPKPPEIIAQDRWGCVKLRGYIKFDIPNVVKLAKASDPRTSSFAIYHDDNNELFIWGLIDQGNRYYDYANYESDSWERPERPGIFQASIEGSGFLVAYQKHKKIAELRINRLVREAVNIFSKGPIKDAFDIGVNRHKDLIIKKVGHDVFYDENDWEDSICEYWYSTICRILLRIKSYRHGGALLFSNGPTTSGLNIKYPVRYIRLKKALVNRAVKLIEMTNASANIFDIIEADDNANLPRSYYLEEDMSKTDLSNIRSEIDGALWFISLLSRVDGLVLLNKRLTVRGFGVEIKSSKSPNSVYRCSTNIPNESKLEEVDYNHFGTRHRSMIRYCWNYSGSVGFVVSQDGDVRAITKHKDKLIIWDNIKLQAYTFVKRRILRSSIKLHRG